jgi:hypothetical protein
MELLIEELAAVEHGRWAHWQEYVHQQCQRLDDGSLVIPAHLVSRWEKQIDTPYDQLSEQEKQSDREQVERVLPILARFFPLNADGS